MVSVPDYKSMDLGSNPGLGSWCAAHLAVHFTFGKANKWVLGKDETGSLNVTGSVSDGFTPTTSSKV